MKWLEQTYNDKEQKIKVVFEGDETAAFYMMKARESGIPIRIKVLQDKKVIAQYFRVFESETLNNNAYNSFIKEFLTDPASRKEFETEDGGTWSGRMDFVTATGVNKKCYDAISRLNKAKPNKLKFKFFAELKTYGMDRFSRMKKEKLVELLPENEVAYAEQAFEEEKAQLTCLRWMARGLEPELSVRKVKTDLEIQNNMGYRR